MFRWVLVVLLVVPVVSGLIVQNDFPYVNIYTGNLTISMANITTNFTTTINITNNITYNVSGDGNNYTTALWMTDVASDYWIHINRSGLPELNTTFVDHGITAETDPFWTAVNDTVLSNIDGRVRKSGDNMTGNLNVSGNVTALGYLFGQPLLGMLGSGVIESWSTNALSEVNVSCAGLVCSWSNFTVRLVSGTSNQFAKYCPMLAGSVVAADNQQSVFYVDDTCTVQSQEISVYFGNTLKQGGLWDFANVVCYQGNCELTNGIGLEQRRMMKQRIINFEKNHLSIVSGMDRQTGPWPQYNITAGKYIYLMDVMTTTQKNGSIETWGRNGTTDWQHTNQPGINVTHCDNGTGIVACTGTGWRRHFIFLVGYNDTTDSTELHGLYPSLSITYTSSANCLDTTTTPLTYTLPQWYQKSAVMLYAFCAQRTTTAWTTNFIDLRTVKTSTAASTIDTSIFLTTDGSRTLTSNWNASFNVSADWFRGKINASDIQSVYWVSGNGTTGKVPKWSSATGLTDSIMNVNANESIEVEGSLIVRNDTSIGGNLLLGGAIVTVTGVNATGNILPAADDTYTLGGASKRFSTAYAKTIVSDTVTNLATNISAKLSNNTQVNFTTVTVGKVNFTSGSNWEFNNIGINSGNPLNITCGTYRNNHCVLGFNATCNFMLGVPNATGGQAVVQIC